MPCAECGRENGQGQRFCIHCGIPLGAAPADARVRRRPFTPVRRSVDREFEITIISVGTIAVLFAVAFLLTGRNVRAIPALLFLFFPLILGESVFLFKPGKPVSSIEKFHIWLAGKKRTNVRRKRPLHKRLLWPFLFCPTKISQWTESIEDRYLRAGVTISLSLYALGFITHLMVSIIVVIALRQ